MNVSTDWTLVLQKEIAAQDDVVSHLNINMHLPVSPTTTRGTTPPTAAEQETALAKSQLGFIDLFAEPLWNIGARAFFPGMAHGVAQIRENRQVWMSKVSPPAKNGDGEATSSFSTVTSAGVGEKSEGSLPTTPQSGIAGGTTGVGVTGEVRKVVSSGDLGIGNKGNKMRRQRSFSSLIFWRKRGGQKYRQQNQERQEVPQ